MARKPKKTQTNPEQPLYIDGPRGKYLIVTDENFNALLSIPEISAYWKEIEEEADKELEDITMLIRWATESQGCAGVYVHTKGFYHLNDAT